VAIGMLTFFYRESAGGFVHRVQDGALRMVSPLQKGAARAIKPFRDAWNWTADLFHANSQNKELRRQLAQLRINAAQLAATQEQNKELSGLLRWAHGGVFPATSTRIVARVIARSTLAWYSTVTIDGGRSAGVHVYDAVVNDQGLVGRVTSVTSDAAQVTLITDEESYVDAETLASNGNPHATAQGGVAGSVTGDLTMEYVDRSAKVQVGQFVITSGMKDSIFVRGIPIGEVTSVGRQDVNLYQSISVKPFVDFHTLDMVMVVHS
jgi:rod shape-determining protein MreC